MQTIKVTTELRDGQLYLHVSNNGVTDVVGPVSTDSEAEYTAVLQGLQPGPGAPSKQLRKRAALTERRIAEDIGGKTQKNSGALPWAKGDIRKKGEHRIEVKTCTLRGYRVARHDLDKIRGECAYGEKPGFVIEFINRLTHKMEDRWILIPYEDWRGNETNIDQ